MQGQVSFLNQEKAHFFDQNVNEAWAAHEYGPKEAPKIKRLLAESCFKKGLRVLEPGCGTGRLTRVMAKVVGNKGMVTALDISQGMAQACKDRNSDLENVEVHQACVEDFSHSSPPLFDRIICHQVFPHFDDQELACRAMSGMLKPGGILAVIHFEKSGFINDVHRKAGTVVEKDLIPEQAEMEKLLASHNLITDLLVEDKLGYYLRAVKS
ncbi:class I SAM-dependent methyltransferase [Dethiosulfatarculus sandiegensis]|uniref:SAM-dependent methyltransferase n=1 Tax=Dethiosulfatarculus sandiegensis TaxID=1429043 RepID=A0A0D2HNT8_9BACT|nr:class I SAM-dependent methyltransferase [Dethiosulfatarculus sandiegensis]KIX12233.1 SAM-dependent methyltransferase [Dethiosulfatarculus sandiegensis]